ncbi:L-fuculose-phosphate aldolase [Thermovibrio guaymasensis]|uniref:L-fuculose-phosphate aldolase n=1 Tax=Thermovibrio guaymasensis TaxID=240167 RepID=A0A420W8F6_9BACT|nr:class II aldolase/adducin family protein [Thermovibrio guaymasensis]RKQ63601.1 L-fuculose-phosphate aldolase [Thermovibrio guaymasensis]
MLPFLNERLELIEVAKLTFQLGLTDSHGGNLSCRAGDFIIIKRSGKSLGRLQPEDFVVTTINENPSLDRFASVELKVHRAIYKNLTGVKAVLHAHSPYTVACSLKFNEIEPLDSESKLLLGDKIPVLKAKEVVSSEEVAERLPGLLRKCPVAVVYSHGPFAVGRNIEEALKYLSALENSCKILTFYSQLR